MQQISWSAIFPASLIPYSTQRAPPQWPQHSFAPRKTPIQLRCNHFTNSTNIHHWVANAPDAPGDLPLASKGKQYITVPFLVTAVGENVLVLHPYQLQQRTTVNSWWEQDVEAVLKTGVSITRSDTPAWQEHAELGGWSTCFIHLVCKTGLPCLQRIFLRTITSERKQC